MIRIETLSNGLTVIVEEIPSLESVAYELLIPGGILTDTHSSIGASLVLAEITSRGAGTLDAMALSNAFDSAGIRHGEYAGQERIVYRGSLLPDKLVDALRLVKEMVLAPTFPKDELEPIQSLYLQDIRSLPDTPARRVMIELSALYYPEPYGRPGIGTEKGIESATIESLTEEWKRLYRAGGSVFSIAGNIKADEVIKCVKDLFGSWKGEGVSLPQFGSPRVGVKEHIQSEAAQLQIALSYPSARFGDPQYYTAKVANGILSGGMFGRLFIEVREKRGLCYSVYSRHAANEKFGTVTAYAGTTPDRAQETFDVLYRELINIPGTITADELSRSKANLKAAVIISEEGASSRAGSNANDYLLGKRIRSLDEIAAAIDAVTAKDIDQYFTTFSARSCTVLTLGSKALSFEEKKI